MRKSFSAKLARLLLSREKSRQAVLSGLFQLLLEAEPGLVFMQVRIGSETTVFGERSENEPHKHEISFPLSIPGEGSLLIGSRTPVTDAFQEALEEATQLLALEMDTRNVYEGELRRMTHELSKVEEQERRAIASELHDQIGQNLAILKMKLSQLQGDAIFQGFDADFSSIRNLLEETIRSTRSLTYELSSPTLYQFGLRSALESFSMQAREKLGLSIALDSQLESCPLSKDARILLFKATRELLTNVVKHAGTREARVSLRVESGQYVISVTDRGRGFASAPVRERHAGFGLFSIEERLRHVGGRMLIESAPGTGTQVTLLYPLTQGEL